LDAKLKALAAIALGTSLVVAAIWLWAAPETVGRFRCTWPEGPCIATDAGKEHRVPLSSVRRAYVSHSRANGNSLQLVTAEGTQPLAKASMHRDSRREYYAAAAAITALLEQRVESVDVTFTYRAGLMPGMLLAFVGLLASLLGVRSLWSQRRAVPS